ncbi:MAG: toxic anion resistance protein [Bacteroidaceae bacterium]|nr:toxic anion resistance protein [Bacteroidaceae bacterium]
MATTTKARKTRKATTPVVDVEEPVVVTTPKVKRTRKAVSEIEAEAEASLNGTAPANVPQKRISDATGEVSLENIPAKQKEYYKEIAKVLNEKDLTSISSYGSDLQRAMDSYSSDFLNQSFSRENSLESADLIANLLGELHEVNIDDLEAPGPVKRFLRRIPGLKKLVISVEQVKAKYNTIQKNIDGIVKKLEATRQIAIRDNNLLQKQFENNCDYVDQLEDLIVAGKMKSKELEDLLENMKAEAGQYDDYQITDIEEYKNSLDKRITDLIMLRYAFKQSLTQIRIIQRTNIMDANNTEAQITMTIPLWKNQMSLAVALYNQKQSIEISNKVTEATNEMFKKNAEMMKTQAIEVAKQNQRSVLDIETLRKTTQELLAAVEGMQKAQQEGAQKRAAAEAELVKLEKEMSMKAIGVADSTQKVISSELQGIRSQKMLEE